MQCIHSLRSTHYIYNPLHYLQTIHMTTTKTILQKVCSQSHFSELSKALLKGFFVCFFFCFCFFVFFYQNDKVSSEIPFANCPPTPAQGNSTFSQLYPARLVQYLPVFKVVRDRPLYFFWREGIKCFGDKHFNKLFFFRLHYSANIFVSLVSNLRFVNCTFVSNTRVVEVIIDD